MHDWNVEPRRKIIRICAWLIFVAIVTGILFGVTMSVGQDVAGAAMIEAFGILGAIVVVVPCAVIIAWAAWAPWKALESGYKLIAVGVWLLILLPVFAMVLSLTSQLLGPGSTAGDF